MNDSHPDCAIGPCKGRSAPEEKPSSCPEKLSVRALAAEDNKTNQIVLSALLKKADIDLTIVENGLQACEANESMPFDIILMDIDMPVMNGIDATRRIRQTERDTLSSYTPIIAVTASALPSHTPRYMDAGIDAVVSKPVRQDILLDTISTHLNSVGKHLYYKARNTG